ncbi:hypothetical protein K402DRAFT_48479 [Aulographum hederae CBS 113979]|uniref:Uncharacterized protein n=1 Tax=Aulographum hederae CBS 113979 TaxID=1176131 RepID=A0A6G1H2M9_9PEZI|nr:hypothetical protein K402DRAFT_48479 [Aulographum hederae CBS 113979]
MSKTLTKMLVLRHKPLVPFRPRLSGRRLSRRSLLSTSSTLKICSRFYVCRISRKLSQPHYVVPRALRVRDIQQHINVTCEKAQAKPSAGRPQADSSASMIIACSAATRLKSLHGAARALKTAARNETRDRWRPNSRPPAAPNLICLPCAWKTRGLCGVTGVIEAMDHDDSSDFRPLGWTGTGSQGDATPGETHTHRSPVTVQTHQSTGTQRQTATRRLPISCREAGAGTLLYSCWVRFMRPS